MVYASLPGRKHTTRWRRAAHHTLAFLDGVLALVGIALLVDAARSFFRPDASLLGLLVRWPGRARPGTVSSEPICNTDLLPTLCAIAGTKPPAGRALDGADITPLFDGKPVRRPHPLYWQYDFAISKPWQVSLRDGPWKLVANATLTEFELYDVADDVGEKQNLAAEKPEQVRRMAAVMMPLNALFNPQSPGMLIGSNPCPAPPLVNIWYDASLLERRL